jgi:hypothetical protein
VEQVISCSVKRQTFSGLCDLIGIRVEIFKPREGANFFSACGH